MFEPMIPFLPNDTTPMCYSVASKNLRAVAGKTVTAFCVGGETVPSKARKPCAHHGCRELTRDRYCPTHAKEHMKQYNRQQRDPTSKNRYGRHWREVRAAYLSAHPLCFMCQSEGRLTPATTVHHKKKLADGGNHYWGNLMSLCASCHSSLHASEGDYF